MAKIPKELQISNPFDVDEDDYEWLEFGDSIPPKVANPLAIPLGINAPDPVEEMIGIFTSADYLHFTAKMILNVDLPPYQCLILDTLWNKRMPMLIGSRGASKSFILGVYCLLRMILNPGCKIVIVGSGLRQARQVFDYMASVWEKAPILRDIAGSSKSKTAGPRREVDRFQFEIGDSVAIAIPLGDGSKIRGLRANYIIADEFASIPENIFNLVVQGFAIVSKDPVQKIKEAATIKKLKKMGHWTDEMEKLRVENAGGNQIIYSGTAFYAFNHFYKLFQKWHKIIESRGGEKLIREIFAGDEQTAKGFNWKDFAIIRIPYTHVPEGLMDPSMLAQAKATLSNLQFLMEYGAVFASDSNGFYRRSVIESATTNRPIITPDGAIQFSAMKYGDPKKAYVIGIDPAADVDNAAIVILEVNKSHRKIAHCWSTNKQRHHALKQRLLKKGIVIEDDYYRYIAKKIRGFMRVFGTEHIIMDKHGGGSQIAEALRSEEVCEYGEMPIYELIDPNDPKPDDMKEGLHILELVAATNDLNSDANHGMLKDLQDKVLLFPLFDVVELAKAVEQDKLIETEVEDQFDTYEDLVQEIEELKNELASIIVTTTSELGKEKFDTPSVKSEGDKKGHLRKDRYSALLYANWYLRNRDIERVIKIDYRAVGGNKDMIKRVVPEKIGGGMYYGPGLLSIKDSKVSWLAGRNIKRR
jgi:hypothetical protein